MVNSCPRALRIRVGLRSANGNCARSCASATKCRPERHSNLTYIDNWALAAAPIRIGRFIVIASAVGDTSVPLVEGHGELADCERPRKRHAMLRTFKTSATLLAFCRSHDEAAGGNHHHLGAFGAILECTYMAKSFLVPEAPPFRIAHWFVPAVIAVPWSHAGSTQFLERSAVAQGAPRASEHAPAPRCTSTLHRNDLSQVQSIVGLISRAAPCRGPMHHAPDYAPAHAPSRTRAPCTLM